MKSYLAAALLFATACATDDPASPVDEAPDDTPDDEAPPPAPPAPAPVGLKRASPLQLQRAIEAALGLDADYAVIATEAMIGGRCPSVEPIADGIVLRGACTNGPIRARGTATIRTLASGKVYQFDEFEIRLDGSAFRVHGEVRQTGQADRPGLRASQLRLALTYDGDLDGAPFAYSTGSWFNDGHGHVIAFSLALDPIVVSLGGVGGYFARGAVALDEPTGSVALEGDAHLEASRLDEDCWQVAIDGVRGADVCNVRSHIVLSPR